MAARQNDAAMIDLGRRAAWNLGGERASGFDRCSIEERSAAGWAPVGFGAGGKLGVAMAADAVHLVMILPAR